MSLLPSRESHEKIDRLFSLFMVNFKSATLYKYGTQHLLVYLSPLSLREA